MYVSSNLFLELLNIVINLIIQESIVIRFNSLDQGKNSYANDGPLSLSFEIQGIVVLDVDVVSTCIFEVLVVPMFSFIILHCDSDYNSVLFEVLTSF